MSTPSSSLLPSPLFFLFFFNDTATTEIYTLSLHDALPISSPTARWSIANQSPSDAQSGRSIARTRSSSQIAGSGDWLDRKSTRLNSSHTVISYAVFCLKKKEHTSELQSHSDLVCRLLLVKK